MAKEILRYWVTRAVVYHETPQMSNWSLTVPEKVQLLQQLDMSERRRPSPPFSIPVVRPVARREF